MNDWRYDPDVQHITHSDRLGTYEELQVRSGPRVMNTPTWFAASDTATVTKVPAQYGIPTSTDRINELEAQVKQQAATIAALEAYIRDHSERDDVPFGTLRMAEDAWGQGRMTDIDSIRDGIKRMNEAGATPRVLQMNQKTRDALGDGVDALGLRVSIRPTASKGMVYIIQKESVYNYNGKVYDNPLDAELAVDEAFGCDVFGVDWLDITTMDDAIVGREVFVADLSDISCGIGGHG